MTQTGLNCGRIETRTIQLAENPEGAGSGVPAGSFGVSLPGGSANDSLVDRLSSENQTQWIAQNAVGANVADPQGIGRALHTLDSMIQSDSSLDRLADQRIGENGRPAKWIFETVDTMSALPQPGRFLMRCQPSLLPNVDHALERAVMSG